MLKYSYWPKREFCLSEMAEFNFLKSLNLTDGTKYDGAKF